MRKMLATLRRERWWVAAVSVVLALSVFVATTTLTEAVIFPAGPGVTVYYSDATYSTVVGASGTGCCGEVIQWGITTRYKRFERLYCLDVLCPF